MTDFIKGADISTLKEVRECGGIFYNKEGIETDLLTLLKNYDFNYVRLRLWNNPYGDNGEKYGAGNNDFETLLELSKECKAAGFKILLDFHYSDFWADPGKQYPPKAWADFNLMQLEKAVYDFTKDTLDKLEAENVYPDMVQVGNELSNGFLWPIGKWPNFDNIALLVSSGIKAVKECNKRYNHTSKIMIHLDNGGNNKLYREWFDNYLERGEDFDIIGLSYYPFWHGTLNDLNYNMTDIAKRYNKDLVIAEVSMGFSMEDYSSYEGLSPDERKGYATRQELVDKLDYEMTEEGQAKFTQDFLNLLTSIDNNKGKGFFWWEAGWIPVKGSGWATDASLAYIKEKGPCGNEWANQALFTYDGHPLKALDVIKEF
ncbi:MAG: glycosyl hydrolase 53 family protein [Lachnospiraceae bacterium]|nr:glycosyl hydrolase 53 family protein [Lachnospiraceae bacterium]